VYLNLLNPSGRLHRSVSPPSAGLVGVRRGGEPDLWVKFSTKVVFLKD
jgi:hypothetical protein